VEKKTLTPPAIKRGNVGTPSPKKKGGGSIAGGSLAVGFVICAKKKNDLVGGRTRTGESKSRPAGALGASRKNFRGKFKKKRVRPDAMGVASGVLVGPGGPVI